jgi:glycosyltransferase involved in cell wall biosynthesis
VKPHLCHVFPAFGNGGPEVRTAIIINATADAFRHTILSISDDLSGADRIHAGDSVVERVPRLSGWGGAPKGLARTLRKQRPDLLMTYGWGGVDAILVGRLCGFSRVIHGEDGFLPDEMLGQKRHRLITRQLAMRAAARVIVPSRTLVDIADRLWRLPPRKTCYLPNGVDASRFAPATAGERSAARRRFGFDDADIVIGTVGHLRPEKNYARLVDALGQLPANSRTKLLIVGDGELRSVLEEQVDRLGLRNRVVFAGIVADPAECYRAMDVFALSSDTEQMPLVVLEAMGTGLAVVSTDVGDVREMVSADNRAYVTPRANDGAFVRGLAALTEQPQVRSALGRMNRTRCVEQYDLQLMVRRYRSLYSEVLTGVPARDSVVP